MIRLRDLYITSIGLFYKNWEIVEVCLTGGAI